MFLMRVATSTLTSTPSSTPSWQHRVIIIIIIIIIDAVVVAVVVIILVVVFFLVIIFIIMSSWWHQHHIIIMTSTSHHFNIIVSSASCHHHHHHAIMASSWSLSSSSSSAWFVLSLSNFKDDAPPCAYSSWLFRTLFRYACSPWSRSVCKHRLPWVELTWCRNTFVYSCLYNSAMDYTLSQSLFFIFEVPFSDTVIFMV